MIIDAQFDPIYDISEVDQFGFVDLHEAMRTGVIQGNLGNVDLEFDEIENLDTIVGHPSDVFDALRHETYLNSIVSQSEQTGDD